MKRWCARCGLWFPAIGVLLVLARECALPSSRWQNLLPLANLPLTALARWLPYYLLFVLSYLGYGLLLDWLLRRKKRR